MNAGSQDKGRFAVVIPAFNHAGSAPAVVRAAKALGFPIFVVDDGSSDGLAPALEAVERLHLLRHDANRGKGAALLSGFAAAASSADWAITLDADGQHDPQDALALIDAIPGGRRPIIVGCRGDMLDKGAPWTSRFGRAFSNFWVRCSGGPKLSDTQSGFRIYPLPEVLHLNVRARRYQFEVEVLVRAAWRGMPVIEAPVRVSYPPGAQRISHFRPFVDFMRNSRTFSRLIVQRIFCSKASLARSAGRPGKGTPPH